MKYRTKDQRAYWLAAFLVLLSGCSYEQSELSASIAPELFSPDEVAAATRIKPETIRAAVAEISSDAYGGRGPGSAGDEKARRWIAGRLQTLGYRPGAADGSWEQPFDLVGVNTNQPRTWTFTAGEDSLGLVQGNDFIVNSGVQSPQSVIEESELVFVGYGIQAPEYQWDDFKGLDLTGKTLVMLNNDPDWDPDLFAGERRLYYGRWVYKYESAARQGAVAAIIIHTTPSAGYPWQVVQTSGTGAQFQLPAGDEPVLEATAWISSAAAEKLFSVGGHDLTALVEAARSRDFSPVALDVTTSLTLSNELTEVQSANVLGVLPGSDPELADEVVVFTAHHDHLGIGLPNFAGDPTDRIYNGARDNAIGVAMTLAIAEALAASPPRRSVLMAFVGAEEQGLLGSKYFAAEPTFHPGKMAANINLDGGNIWGETTDITFIGYGKSTLDEIATAVAAVEDREVVGDQFPDKGYFYRSDQFNLAKIGVPALFLNSGTRFVGRPKGWGEEQMGAYTAKHYHQPSDELTDDWNFDGVTSDARFAYRCGLLVANAGRMQEWMPGDEFEAARLKAIADAQQLALN